MHVPRLKPNSDKKKGSSAQGAYVIARLDRRSYVLIVFYKRDFSTIGCIHLPIKRCVC
jgi:hypothetical protein